MQEQEPPIDITKLVDEHKNTALHYASGRGNLAAVEALIKYGIDVNHENEDHQHALIAAAKGGHSAVVTTLVENWSDVIREDKNALSAFDASEEWFETKHEVLKKMEAIFAASAQNVYWTYKPIPLERIIKVKKMKTFMVPKMVKVKKKVPRKDDDGNDILDVLGNVVTKEIEVREKKMVPQRRQVTVDEIEYYPCDHVRACDFSRVVCDMPELPKKGTELMAELTEKWKTEDFVLLKCILISIDPATRLDEGEVMMRAKDIGEQVGATIAEVRQAPEDCTYDMLPGDFVKAKMG